MLQVVLHRPEEHHLTETFFYQYNILYTVRIRAAKTSIPLSIVWLWPAPSIDYADRTKFESSMWGVPFCSLKLLNKNNISLSN